MKLLFRQDQEFHGEATGSSKSRPDGGSFAFARAEGEFPALSGGIPKGARYMERPWPPEVYP